nr:hypothetical protein [Tanacetum cinerariifolium]
TTAQKAVLEHTVLETYMLAKPATTQKAVLEHIVPETYGNTILEKHAYIDVIAKAIHMILSGIGDSY